MILFEEEFLMVNTYLVVPTQYGVRNNHGDLRYLKNGVGFQSRLFIIQ